MTLEEGHPDGLVWHYTDATGLLSILSNHTLWATSSAFLNDRQEVRLGGERIAQSIERLASGGDNPWFTAVAERMAQREHAGDVPTSAHFFILSASQSGDSLAMWRLYGGVRESYAIGLDPQAALAVLSHNGATSITDGPDLAHTPDGLMLRRVPWQPVRYRRDDQDELINSIVTTLPERLRGLVGRIKAGEWEGRSFAEADLPPEVVESFNNLTEAVLLIKHEGFVDERETRLAIVTRHSLDNTDPVASDAELLRYRATPYGISPYLALTGVRDSSVVVTPQVAPLPIRAVAISPSPNGPEASESVQRLLTTRGYTDVPVIRSAIPFRSG